VKKIETQNQWKEAIRICEPGGNQSTAGKKLDVQRNPRNDGKKEGK
jgi:hypothetical protein